MIIEYDLLKFLNNIEEFGMIALYLIMLFIWEFNDL